MALVVENLLIALQPGGIAMEQERRKHPRLEISIPISFNLDPDYHYVPALRKRGVVGRARNISPEGLGIDARMDLLDLFQIFPEDTGERAAFLLDVFFPDTKGSESMIKAEVKWYQLSDPEDQVWQFRAGLYLSDAESRAVVKNVPLG
jgi:hypothetical protein